VKSESERYDVAIIGTGIAGSALGAILARQGQRVILFEGKSHPRFAIGESMILETSEVLRAMAEIYDVPELAYFSSENYFAYIGTSHGVKRHFSYLHHTQGRNHDLDCTLQAVIPKQPHGHELHLYRQDSDYFLMSVAISYGATVRQETFIEDVEIDENSVQIKTAKGEAVAASYVVDAGGFRSILAEKYKLRTSGLRTQSRALFTHMIDVPDYHDVGATRQAYGLPFGVSEGTLHHVFEGGWLWVIPFNNHARSTNPLCSVGLMLDPRVHPMQMDLTPEEEFSDLIQRFPSIARQFATAKAVRPWTRTGRIQYGSSRVVGDRFALLGHAAGFVDPLFSKGLYASLTATSVLANLLVDAADSGDYSAPRFQPIEETTQAFIRTNDRLIANAYKSFADYRLWSAYTVIWLLGAYTELVKLSSSRLQATSRAEYYNQIACLKLAGGGFWEYDAIAHLVDSIVEATDMQDEDSVTWAVAEIDAIFRKVDWMPKPFAAVLDGVNHLPANKLRLGLLRGDGGFMGSGTYRQHFFGDRSILDVTRAFVLEKLRYSEATLNVRRRSELDRSKPLIASR
jgi:FADH2 O2-dependent halogenase